MIALSKSYQVFKIMIQIAYRSKGYKEGVTKFDLLKRLCATTWDSLKCTAIPALTGMVLYAPLDESTMRYCTAVCIILTRSVNLPLHRLLLNYANLFKPLQTGTILC